MSRPRPGSRPLDCSQDHLVVAALGQGFGKELVLSGIETPERAHEIRRGIYRCARHRKVSADAGPNRTVTEPGEMGVHKDGQTYTLRFRLWSKRDARKRHLERHGPDRANWPYDPRAPLTAEEKADWAIRDERGREVVYDKEK
jgi:hypothetical protein